MTQPFSQKSLDLLNKCHPDLKLLFLVVNEEIQCTILPSTIRTLDQQRKFVADGLSKTMDSKHLLQQDGYSHAVDAAPDPVNFERKSFNLDLIYFAGYVMAIAKQLYEEGRIKHQVRYGGDWNKNYQISDESFQDTDHFEILDA